MYGLDVAAKFGQVFLLGDGSISKASFARRHALLCICRPQRESIDWLSSNLCVREMII